MPELEITDNDIDEFLQDYNQRLSAPSMALEFDDDRRAIIKAWDDVQACPGSGKTTIVAAKLLILEKKLRSRAIPRAFDSRSTQTLLGPFRSLLTDTWQHPICDQPR